jgi:hypothetical protein
MAILTKVVMRCKRPALVCGSPLSLSRRAVAEPAGSFDFSCAQLIWNLPSSLGRPWRCLTMATATRVVEAAVLVLQLVLDIVLIIFVLAFLPLFLGDLLLFANPASGFAFLLTAAAFITVLWAIDHVMDESFWAPAGGAVQIAVRISKRWVWQSPVGFLNLRAG